jgi:hypothetical protein
MRLFLTRWLGESEWLSALAAGHPTERWRKFNRLPPALNRVGLRFKRQRTKNSDRILTSFADRSRRETTSVTGVALKMGGTVTSVIDSVGAYDARHNIDAEANEIGRLINSVFEQIMSIVFPEEAKANSESEVVLRKCPDVSSTSRVLDIWDRVEGLF